jgi:ankyrin repeat protein
MGWPLDARGGDWSATALNLAVFHGNIELTKFLLEHGASWTEGHGFGDNVCGTLSWASVNNHPDHDWVGIARLLVAHGMPGAEPLEDSGDPRQAGCVRIGGKIKRFSGEVTEFLLEHGRR